MTHKIYKPDPELARDPFSQEILLEEVQRQQSRVKMAERVRILLHERSFLLRTAGLGLLLGLILAFVIPVRYTSTSRLMPPDNQSSSMLTMAAAAMSGKAGGLTEMAGDLLGVHSTSDLFVGIVGSRTAQDRLIEQFKLQKLYGVRKMEDARKKLAARTGVGVDRKTQIITISVTDHSPQLAAQMNAAYIDELNHLVSDLSTSSARREREFLEERLKSVRVELNDAERQFSEFASKNSTIDIKEQARAMVEGAAALQGQLISAESEYEGLRQIYSDDNVRVRSVRARIEELRRQLEKIGGKGEAFSLQDQNGAPAVSPNSELYPSIRKLPLLGVQYADLYRNAKVQEVVFEALTQQYELAKVQEAKEIPTVKVLDAPNIPETKDFPPRIPIILFGGMLGLVAGIIFVLASRTWQATDPNELGKALATEIWIDLRQHGLLNRVNGANGLNSGAPNENHPVDDDQANSHHDQANGNGVNGHGPRKRILQLLDFRGGHVTVSAINFRDEQERK